MSCEGMNDYMKKTKAIHLQRKAIRTICLQVDPREEGHKRDTQRRWSANRGKGWTVCLLGIEQKKDCWMKERRNRPLPLYLFFFSRCSLRSFFFPMDPFCRCVLPVGHLGKTILSVGATKEVKTNKE